MAAFIGDVFFCGCRSPTHNSSWSLLASLRYETSIASVERRLLDTLYLLQSYTTHLIHTVSFPDRKFAKIEYNYRTMMQAFVSPAFRRTIVGKSSSLLQRRSPTTVVRSFASIYHADMEDLSHEETSSPSSTSSSSCAHSLLILGKPGGGKGTISGKILSDFPQFRHVSTGDQLRQHVRNETKLGLEAKKYMDGE